MLDTRATENRRNSSPLLCALLLLASRLLACFSNGNSNPESALYPHLCIGMTQWPGVGSNKRQRLRLLPGQSSPNVLLIPSSTPSAGEVQNRGPTDAPTTPVPASTRPTPLRWRGKRGARRWVGVGFVRRNIRRSGKSGENLRMRTPMPFRRVDRPYESQRWERYDEDVDKILFSTFATVPFEAQDLKGLLLLFVL